MAIKAEQRLAMEPDFKNAPELKPGETLHTLKSEKTETLNTKLRTLNLKLRTPNPKPQTPNQAPMAIGDADLHGKDLGRFAQVLSCFRVHPGGNSGANLKSIFPNATASR